MGVRAGTVRPQAAAAGPLAGRACAAPRLPVREGGPGVFGDIPDSFLHVYSPPYRGRLYAGFLDVAEGKDPQGTDDSDWNALVLIDDETWEEVLTYHARCQPDEFAKHAMAIAAQYKAVVIPERNNHGHAVLATFRLLRFPLLRGHGRWGPGVRGSHDGYEGWLTNVQTKPMMIDLLGEGLRTASWRSGTGRRSTSCWRTRSSGTG